jgi:hypothetical protein
MISEVLAHVLREATPPSKLVRIKLTESVEAEFRLLNDMTERLSIQREATEWAASFSKTFRGGRAIGPLKEFGTDDLQVLAQAKVISTLCVTEGLNDVVHWLMIAKQAASVFAGVSAAIDAATSNTASEYAVYVDEKKDLSATEPEQLETA